MELVDIYDKNGEPTGEVRDRKTQLTTDVYIMAVGLWIVDSAGRIFLTRRSQDKGFAPGKLENTEGHVLAGESPVEAMVRELHEETGLTVDASDLVLLGRTRGWPYWRLDYGVRMDVDLTCIHTQDGETCDPRLVSFEEFREIYQNKALSPAIMRTMPGYMDAFLEFVGHPGKAMSRPEMKRASTELIDIYNPDGTPTGKTQDRSAPLGPDEYRMAVGIWIQDSQGRIFLTKRSPEKRFAPNKWENPAGHVKAGEGPIEAVIRELHEETGIQIKESQITLLGCSCNWPYLGRDYGVRMDVDLSRVRLQEGETCDAKLVTYKEFRSMYESGELASSVVEHMEDYKTAFLDFIGEAAK